MRDGKVIYERYDAKRKINSNTPLLGMSLSKTAVAASIGSLLLLGWKNKITKIKLVIILNF